MILTVRRATGPVRLHGVQMHQSNYPVAEVGRLACSDRLLTDIWEISRRTVRVCMEDTFVDCPAYEQVFWVGDARNSALFSYFLFGAEPLVERCLRLVPGSQFQTPLLADQAPSGWSSVIPIWTFLWAIACHEYYVRTGDTGFVREMWPKVRQTLDAYLTHVDHRGLLSLSGWNFIDWAPMDQPGSGVVTHQHCLLITALEVGADLARLAGDSGEHLLRAAARLREAANRHLWSEERQAYRDAIHADGRLSTTFSMQSQIMAFFGGCA